MTTRGLHNRVKKLEQRDGPCGVCAGLGRLALVIEEPDGTVPEPEGCRGCGKIMKLILIEAEKLDAQAAG